VLCCAVICCAAVCCQGEGLDDAEQQQAVAAEAVQLPWLGPILQTALVPMQVGGGWSLLQQLSASA
jgi:hypothetical protein